MNKKLFDENLYPPKPQFAAEYARYTRRGYLRMRDTSAILCGLARNVEPFLNDTIARIDATGRLFGDYRVLIYENDSTDNTLPILQKWAQNDSRVEIISQILADPVNPGTRDMGRVERMARYRNVCRERIVEHYHAYEYTILIDTDLPGGWSFDGLANTFGHQNWDFVGSNGILSIVVPRRAPRIVHFDAFAYREHGRPEPHTAQEVNPKQFWRGEHMRPMFSCFGGMGVYRTPAMSASAYAGGDCEHVPFHLGMRKAGFEQQFLNPSQIVLYGERGW